MMRICLVTGLVTWTLYMSLPLDSLQARIDDFLGATSYYPYQSRMLEPMFINLVHNLHLGACFWISFWVWVSLYLCRSSSQSWPFTLIVALMITAQFHKTPSMGDLPATAAAFCALWAALRPTVWRSCLLVALIFVAALSRLQVIFCLAWYLIETRACLRHSILVVLSGAGAWAAARELVASDAFNPYSFTMHTSINTDPHGFLFWTLPIWCVTAGIVLVIAFIHLARRGTRRDFLFAASLCVYVCLFFIKGNLWESAKATPGLAVLYWICRDELS